MNLCLEGLRDKMIRETEHFLRSRLDPREPKARLLSQPPEAPRPQPLIVSSEPRADRSDSSPAAVAN